LEENGKKITQLGGAQRTRQMKKEKRQRNSFQKRGSEKEETI